MTQNLTQRLQEAHRRGQAPSVVAYNRIDGPGSSLDLREFQQALWTLPRLPENDVDATAAWTLGLPRTVGITIDTGTRVTAQPYDYDKIAVQSAEYGTNIEAASGHVHPSRENWLLKIIDLFGLSGVRFVLRNLKPGTHSAGLGGSATATTGVCVLANELAGRPFGATQLVSLASRIEQDLGVSLTGTQEQSNVLFGGVTDYVWFPWGVPGRLETGYGSSTRFALLPRAEYGELERRMAIFHSGRIRSSTDVNSVWTAALSTPAGYQLHSQQLKTAYAFREGIRLKQWTQVIDAVRQYREVRTALCAQYMSGSEDMLAQAESHGCTIFPLGAGGGGGILVFSTDPDALRALRRQLSVAYLEISFRIKERGHDLFNMPQPER